MGWVLLFSVGAAIGLHRLLEGEGVTMGLIVLLTIVLLLLGGGGSYGAIAGMEAEGRYRVVESS